MSKPADQRLREYLADRDEPCPSCGYNLRGLENITCPECGQRVNLYKLLHHAEGVPKGSPLLVAVILSTLLLGYVVFYLALSGDQLTTALVSLTSSNLTVLALHWFMSRRRKAGR